MKTSNIYYKASTSVLMVFAFQLMLLFSSCHTSVQPGESQISHVDSLLTALRQSMIEVNMVRSAELAFEASIYSQKANYYHGHVRATYMAGQNLFNAGLSKEALRIFNNIDTARTTAADALYTAQIYKVQGQILYAHNQPEESLRIFDDALVEAAKVAKRANGQYITSQVYESKAVVYNGMGDPQTALDYLLRNEQLLEQMDEDFVFNNKINNYTLLGEQYLLLENPDSSAYWLEQAMDIIERYSYAYRSRTLMATGRMFMQQTPPNITQAIDHYYAARKNIEETGIKYELPRLFELMIEAFNMLGQSATALYYTTLQEDIQEELSSYTPDSNDAMQEVVNNYHRQLKLLNHRIIYFIATFAVTILIAISISVVHRVRHIKKETQISTII